MTKTKEAKLKWWGYLHESGTIQAKRYFSREDISEAETSDFVQETYGPFDADGREDALKILSDYFKAEGKQ